jgi:arginine decarboxylase-like protein
MFIQYFLPHLNSFSERYDGLGIHCCANARHQWENIKKTSGLRLLNISNQGRMVREAYSFFADFAAQWNYDQSPVPLAPLDWLKEIPANAHVVFDITVETKDDALRISEKLGKFNG